VLADQLDNVRGVALGNGNAYFGAYSDCIGVGVGQLMKVPTAGGQRTPLTQTLGWRYDSILVDTPLQTSGAKVYFVFHDDATSTSGIAEADEQ
jgi:hypothetical protein